MQSLSPLIELLRDRELHLSTALSVKKIYLSDLAPCGQSKAITGNGAPENFNGRYRRYRGTYTRYVMADKEVFDVEVYLQRSGNKVVGAFDFGLGAGRIANGYISGSTLYFTWNWSNSQGKGVLKVSSSGQSIEGTWRYTAQGQSRAEGGGRWELRRH